MKKRTYLVIRLGNNLGVKVEAFDVVHALNLVMLDQHGFVLAKNSEIIFGERFTYAKGDGFAYAAMERPE